MNSIAHLAVLGAATLALASSPASALSGPGSGPAVPPIPASAPQPASPTAGPVPTLTVTSLAPAQYKGVGNAYIGVRVAAGPHAAAGKIRLTKGKKKLKTVKLRAGRALIKVPDALKVGSHRLTITYVPTGRTKAAASVKLTLKVRQPTAARAAVMTGRYCRTLRREATAMSVSGGFDVDGTAGLDRLPRSDLLQAAKSMDKLSSVAATAGTAELWATAADTLRWKAGTLTELRLLVRHPQVLNGTSQLGEATAAIGQELATCGLTNPL